MKLVYVATVPITLLAFLRGQNRYLKERGFELVAIASPGPELDAVARRDGIETVAVPIARRIDPRGDLRAVARLYRELRRIRPDMLHVSTPKAALLGALAGWLARVPIRLFFVRGLASESERGAKRSLFHALERLTARLCTDAVCVSPSLLEYARSQGILRDARVFGDGMSNGVDVARFAPRARPAHARADTLCIGFLGRLVRDKGIEELEAAWTQVRNTLPGARLLLVGEWEAGNPVAPDVRRRLEADPRVELTGHVGDPVSLYAAMDLFVFPSHREGFPNAPMEAAAMGLPVISTRVAGCADAVVDGETGTLVPPRDPEALAAAIERYAGDPRLRAAHGAAGRTRVVQRFRDERIWQATFEAYRGLLAARGIEVGGAAVPAPVGVPPVGAAS